MKIAFTVCTNSFVPFARVLGKSLLQHNKEYEFFIGLCDTRNEDISDLYKDFETIPCGDIGISELDDMATRYSLQDIKNALKPFFLAYFAERFPDAEHILFVDPDMVVYDRLDEIEKLHQSADILLTPHILHPQRFDGKNPTEISYLITGTYNLGMFSIKVNANTWQFINWWRERLKDYCYIDRPNGLYHDQKWINLAPAFFEKVATIKHPGYNVAYWNLHERVFTEKNGKMVINENYPLVVYHFSNVDLKGQRLLTNQQNRFIDKDFPLIMKMYKQYMLDASNEGLQRSITIPCYYAGIHERLVRQRMKRSLKGRLVLWAKDNVPASIRTRWKKKLGI